MSDNTTEEFKKPKSYPKWVNTPEKLEEYRARIREAGRRFREKPGGREVEKEYRIKYRSNAGGRSYLEYQRAWRSRPENSARLKESRRKWALKEGSKEKNNRWQAEIRQDVRRSYAAALLKIRVSQLTDEMHQLFKEQLELRRARKELDQLLKDMKK